MDGFLRLAKGAHSDPFSILGPQDTEEGTVITVFTPGADALEIHPESGARATALPSVDGCDGLFSGVVAAPGAYRVLARAADGATWAFDDPYRFGPVLSDFDLHLIAEGTHQRLWEKLGAHVMDHEGVRGTHFAVWAPHAQRVSVVGDFNQWDGRRYPFRRHDPSGVWELFVPGLGEGARYKYEILGCDGTLLPPKADPVGFGSEHPPANASVVRRVNRHEWHDAAWMEERGRRNPVEAPISVYEVHLGSWRRNSDGTPLSYADAATALVSYAQTMGFTHIELLPISEHPFDGSWGYQPVGLYAPTVRYGPPEGLQALVDAAHQAGLGVILDWVPGHFPTDPHGLGRFDGAALYEHKDPRAARHPEWNTLLYDYGRPGVQNYLLANALYWLEVYHVDVLRVDAVSAMLYRDHGRAAGDWVPNPDGGRENHEAAAFLRRLNDLCAKLHPGTMTIAEESSAFPGVTRSTNEDGLGFAFKWNMGWAHDTLDYMRKDPEARRRDHHKLTFGLTYAFSERFMLSISHDEVGPDKGSMLDKMPGTPAEAFANLRAYFGFMWGHPGKKLLFMGQEFGARGGWRHDGSLDWDALDTPAHAGVQRLVRDLNRLYRAEPALHTRDSDPAGFDWIEADDSTNSVYAWRRNGTPADPMIVVLCNFGSQAQPCYRIGLPQEGRWQVVLDTDAADYGGGRQEGRTSIELQPQPWQGQPFSTTIRLAPFSTVFLRRID
ncbi:1,4-alpha-glucan branching protein GlgB [Cognatishimia sp. F0-27]|nr:1,4-alpha-glucan branching protein GlgB [Cognatishimia sp. F0-27]